MMSASLLVLTSRELLLAVTQFQSGVPEFINDLWQAKFTECERTQLRRRYDINWTKTSVLLGRVLANSALSTVATLCRFILSRRRLTKWDIQRSIAEHGRTDALEWFLAEFGPSHNLRRAFEYAIRYKQNETAQWISEKYPDIFTKPSCEILHAVVSWGNLGVLQALLATRARGAGQCYGLLADAAERGYLHIVEFVHTNNICTYDHDVITSAARYDHWNVVRYLVEHEIGSQYDIQAASEIAANRGNMEMVRFLADHCEDSRLTSAVTSAVRNGHEEVVKYLLNHMNARVSPMDLEIVASQGKLEFLQYLRENDPTCSILPAMNAAAGTGNLEIVKYLHGNIEMVHFPADHCEDSRLTSAVTSAVRNGHEEVVKYLLNHMNARVSPMDLEIVASQGKLEFLQNLRENNPTCSVLPAMNAAAGTGNLEIVKYLHGDFLRESGVGNAGPLINAAKGEYLEIVRYLHQDLREHSEEWYLSSALYRAAKGGHLDIVKYLYESRGRDKGHFCSVTEAFKAAAEKQHLDIVRYLYEDYLSENPKGAPGSLIKAAANGHLEIVKFLYDDQRYNYRRRPEVFDLAVKHGRLEVIRYLHEMGHHGCLQNPVSPLNKWHFDCFIFFLENGYIAKTKALLDKTARDAVRRYDLKVLTSVHRLGAEIPPSMALETIEHAIRYKSVDMIRYLHEEMGLSLGDRADEIAVERCSEEVAEYIGQHQYMTSAQVSGSCSCGVRRQA